MTTNRRIRSIFMCFCVLALLAAIISSALQIPKEAVAGPSGDVTVLEQAFNTTGANLQDVSVNAWVKLENPEITPEQLMQAVDDSVQALGFSGMVLEYKICPEDGRAIVQVSGQTGSQIVNINAQILDRTGAHNKQEAYLSINIEESNNNTNIGALENKLLNVVKEKGNSYAITTCLSGWVSGKLEEEKMCRSIRKAFDQVQARVEEGMSSPNVVSYSGYAAAIDRSVLIGKKNINLNMAMRHHSTENRTYVTAASPIITCEY